MTPSESSPHQDKTLVPAAENKRQFEFRLTDGESDDTAARTDTGTNTEPDLTATADETNTKDANPDPNPDPDTDSPVLIRSSPLYNGGVHHAIDTDGTPLCGVTGEFTRVSKAHARERTTGLCQSCNTMQTGEADRRPCPTCGQAISVTQWPQHVRTCEDHDQNHRHRYPNPHGGDL